MTKFNQKWQIRQVRHFIALSPVYKKRVYTVDKVKTCLTCLSEEISLTGKDRFNRARTRMEGIL